jgi:hypothetical protein
MILSSTLRYDYEHLMPTRPCRKRIHERDYTIDSDEDEPTTPTVGQANKKRRTREKSSSLSTATTTTNSNNCNDWWSNFNMSQCLQMFDYYSNCSNSNSMTMLPNCAFMNKREIQTSNITGLEKMFVEAGLYSMFDIRYFLFMYKIKCASKLEITRCEWMFGMHELKVDTTEKLRIKLNELVHELSQWNGEKAKHFLTYVFNLLRDRSDSRSIDTIIAAHSLHCIMKGRSPLADSFCNFLVAHHDTYKVLHVDQWKIFIDFSNAFPSVEYAIHNFDANDAWPYLYDEFIDWLAQTNGLRAVQNQKM